MPARRQFGLSAVFFADMHMLFSMHKPRAPRRKIKPAAGLPKTLGPDSAHVLFGRPTYAWALFWSIGLSGIAEGGFGLRAFEIRSYMRQILI